MPWVSPPSLQEGEIVVVEFLANRSQGWRAVGGKVWITSHRLLFLPNAVDVRTGGQEFSCRRSDIRWIDVEPPTTSGGPFSGGLRRRLRVELADESTELFVVNRVETLVQTIRAELGLF